MTGSKEQMKMRMLCRLSLLALSLVMAGVPVRAAQQAVAPTPTELVDINRATLEQLAALPGMGDAYARRIVAGRPYRAKNQLVQRGILPVRAYREIKDRIVAHRMDPVSR